MVETVGVTSQSASSVEAVGKLASISLASAKLWPTVKFRPAVRLRSCGLPAPSIARSGGGGGAAV